MKNLFLIRGLPGSGKSTLGELICKNVISADDFFIDNDGIYRFDMKKIKHAHADCQRRAINIMATGEDLAIANTFTRGWEFAVYYEMAAQFGYTVFSMVVESRHCGKNIHDVPYATIDAMRDRFEIKL